MFKQHLAILCATAISIGTISTSNCNAQEPTRSDKIFFRSGFGFAFPIAESRHYLSPKFSTSLGGLVFFGKNNFFFYPKLGLNAYGYDQLYRDLGENSRVMHGRSTTYLLSADFGYRKSVKNFGFYGFSGAGGGVVLVPKLSEPEADIIRMYNTTNLVALVEAGLGTDYSFGNVLLFAEGSYTYGLNKLDQQRYKAVPVSIGVRTNITKIFYNRQN